MMTDRDGPGASRVRWTWRIAFPAAAFFAAAGGLGLAPVGALAGAGLAAPRRALVRLRTPGLAIGLAILTIEWFCLSWLWSPYDRPDQLFKLALLTPLFAMIPFAASRSTGRTLSTLRTMIVFAASAALLFLLFEAASDGAITFSFKRGVEGYTAGMDALRGHIDRSLSRGSFPILMLAGPTALLLWRAGGVPRVAAPVVWIGALIVSNAFDVTANLIAFLVATSAGAVAFAFPRRAIQAVLVVAALSILFAPGLLRMATEAVQGDLLDRLPLTWAMRVEIWREVSNMIADQPIFGYGLDATRPISRPTEIRGVPVDLVPLHAHNAGLQIWFETGLVGAMLSAATLFAAAAALRPNALSNETGAALCFVLTLWIGATTIGYGLWQEWHHAGLAFAAAAALSLKTDPEETARRREAERLGRQRFERLLAE